LYGSGGTPQALHSEAEKAIPSSGDDDTATGSQAPPTG